jgi:dual specificity protein kinase CLK2/3
LFVWNIIHLEHAYKHVPHTISLCFICRWFQIENILLVNDRETTYGNSRVPESTHIKVIDFGGACYDDAKKSAVINTRQYRAPEVILSTGWSMPSDIWSLGCILAELYQGELLFPTHNNVEHLALMEHVIGSFPFSIIQTARKSGSELARDAFDSGGRHVMERILSAESASFVKKSSRLESIILYQHDDWFLQLLRRMLVFDPEARATAHECLRYLSTIRRDVVRHA